MFKRASAFLREGQGIFYMIFDDFGARKSTPDGGKPDKQAPLHGVINFCNNFYLYIQVIKIQFDNSKYNLPRLHSI